MFALNDTVICFGTLPNTSLALATASATAIGSVHPIAGTTSRFTNAMIRFLSSVVIIGLGFRV